MLQETMGEGGDEYTENKIFKVSLNKEGEVINAICYDIV